MNLVKIISTQIKNGERLVKFLRFGKNDVQECQQGSSFGDDSNAPKDIIAIYSQTGEIGSPVVIGYINKNQLAGVGEKRIYSLKSNGDLSQYVWLKNDGTAEFGGNTDNFVRYSKLEDAFNRLKTDHNELVAKWNAFVSAYAPGSPSTIGTPPTLVGSNVPVSTANIAPAKISELKTK